MKFVMPKISVIFAVLALAGWLVSEPPAQAASSSQMPLAHTDGISALKHFEAYQAFGKHYTKKGVETAVQAYLERNPQILGGLTMENFRHVDTRQMRLPHKDMFYIDYVQRKKLGVEIHDVEFASIRVSVSRLFSGNALLHVRAKVYPSINEILNPAQPMPTGRIFDEAVQSVGIKSGENTVYHAEKIITAGEDNTLAVKTLLTFENDPHQTVVVGPDGIEGIRFNTLHIVQSPFRPPKVTGTLQGRGYEFFTSPEQQPEVLPIVNAGVSLNSTVGLTTKSGSFRFLNEPAGEVNGRLLGPYADVIDFQGTNLSFSSFAPQNFSTTISVNPEGSDEAVIAQVNAFHHVNVVHDWVKDRTGFEGIDWPVQVVVNDKTRQCGAGYNGIVSGADPYLYFSAGDASLGCNNFAYDTVIYHEYVHFIDDMAGNIAMNSAEARALSEGLADTLAAYITEQPMVLQADKHARSVDNDAVYPHQPLDQIHHLGNAFSGFTWDFREKIIERYGDAEVAEQLVLAPLIGNAGSIPEAVESIILADDNDNNLLNGTPNFDAIAEAAAAHHLYPIVKPASAQIAASFGDAAAADTGAAQVTVQGTAGGNTFVSYQLSFGTGSTPTQWTDISQPTGAPVDNGTLGTWILPEEPGTYTLRLVVNTDIPILKYQYMVPVYVNSPEVAVTDRPSYYETLSRLAK